MTITNKASRSRDLMANNRAEAAWKKMRNRPAIVDGVKHNRADKRRLRFSFRGTGRRRIRPELVRPVRYILDDGASIQVISRRRVEQRPRGYYQRQVWIANEWVDKW